MPLSLRTVFVFCLVVLSGVQARAVVVAWESITSTTTQGTPSVGPLGYVYENDVTVVTSFSSGGDTFTPLIEFPASEFILKSNPAQTRVWYERNEIANGSLPTGYTGSPLADLDDMFDVPLRINFGSDDTFRKTLDSIYFTDQVGVQINDPVALTDAGVSVLERGANDNNFSVRLVLGVDGTGAPTAFSPTVTIAGGDPFGSGVASMRHALWDSANTNGVGPFDDPDDLDRVQQIGGLLLTFDEFGLSVGDRVYGYEIAAAASGTRTGLDLLASGAAFIKDTLPDGALTIIPSPEPTGGLTMLGILITLSLGFWRQRDPNWNGEQS